MHINTNICRHVLFGKALAAMLTTKARRLPGQCPATTQTDNGRGNPMKMKMKMKMKTKTKMNMKEKEKKEKEEKNGSNNNVDNHKGQQHMIIRLALTRQTFRWKLLYHHNPQPTLR